MLHLWILCTNQFQWSSYLFYCLSTDECKYYNYEIVVGMLYKYTNANKFSDISSWKYWSLHIYDTVSTLHDHTNVSAMLFRQWNYTKAWKLNGKYIQMWLAFTIYTVSKDCHNLNGTSQKEAEYFGWKLVRFGFEFIRCREC